MGNALNNKKDKTATKTCEVIDDDDPLEFQILYARKEIDRVRRIVAHVGQVKDYRQKVVLIERLTEVRDKMREKSHMNCLAIYQEAESILDATKALPVKDCIAALPVPDSEPGAADEDVSVQCAPVSVQS